MSRVDLAASRSSLSKWAMLCCFFCYSLDRDSKDLSKLLILTLDFDLDFDLGFDFDPGFVLELSELEFEESESDYESLFYFLLGCIYSLYFITLFMISTL